MKIVIVAGGTGGHLYPGIALARALSGHEIILSYGGGIWDATFCKKKDSRFERFRDKGCREAFRFGYLAIRSNL